eukprot:10848506-Alexandrium_andersonii.AAC.1
MVVVGGFRPAFVQTSSASAHASMPHAPAIARSSCVAGEASATGLTPTRPWCGPAPRGVDAWAQFSQGVTT